MKTKNQPTLLRLLMAALMMIVCLSAGADTKPDGDGEEITFSQTVNGAKLKFKLRTGDQSGITNAKVMGFAEDTNFNGVLHIPATVTYNGTMYNISTVNGFHNCNNITGVILDRISTIEEYAFYNCQNLTFVQVSSIFLADDGYDIDKKGFQIYAFWKCTALTEINIPQKANKQFNQDPYKLIESYTISMLAFYECSNLSNITVTNNDPDAENSYYTSNGVLFLNYFDNQTPKTQLVLYPPQRTNASYIVPSRVTDFADNAFMDNIYLQSVTIRDGVYIIPYRLFYSCTSLKNVKLPNSISSIGLSAFEYCTKLDSIKLPYNLENIYDYAFKDCESLKTVTAKNPTAPFCKDHVFSGIESQIDLYVPVGSDYAQYDPWKRMKSITETYTLENYGIRVLGREVNEINYKDVFNNGRVRYNTNGTLYLYKVDVSSTSDNIKYIDNYGVDDLFIDITGTCKISTTGTGSYPFYLQKKTTFIGDTLLISGSYGVSSFAPVSLMNDVYYAEASNKMFFTPSLTVNGATSFLGALGESATAGWIGELNLGTGCSLVGWEDGHDLTYDSTQGTILDNGAAMAGGSIFTIGEPFPIYFNNIHLSSATNYPLGSLFRVTHDANGTYTLKGQLSGMANGYPLLKTTASGVILDVQDYSYVSVQGEGVPAFQFGGDVTICGTGPLNVISHYGAGIYISSGTLTFKDLDIDIQGKTVGIYSKRVNKYFQGDLVFDNVAGTIKATNDGSPSINLINSVTLDNCYFVNGFFNKSTHKVDAQELEICRGQRYPTAIDSAPTIQDINGTYYDLQGCRVTTPQPGQIYIVRDAKGKAHKVVAK